MQDLDRQIQEEELFLRLGWFIRLRWAFLASLATIVLLTTLVFKIALPVAQIFAVWLVILVYNTALWLYHRLFMAERTPDPRATRIEAHLQIGMDLVALTAMIHFAGGVENPFCFFYLFHAIIGSILLSRAEVWSHGVLAYGLFLTVIFLEYHEIIPHYTLSRLYANPRHQNELFILGVSVSLLVTLFTTIYMSSSIVHSLHARGVELLQTRQMLRKKTEDLEEANRVLQQKQTQLVQSEKLVSLGQLSAGVAHEINNPIQFIQGNMRILNESMETILPILDNHASEYGDFRIARLNYPFFRQHVTTLLTDMTNGAVRIAAIVRDLKKFARMDEGRLDEMVDLNEVVKASLRLVHNKIKRYQVVEDLDVNLPAIPGSTSKLEQVMVANLINAAEALGDNPDGKITVRTRREDDEMSVCVSISDNGPGMSEEVKQRLFDPFFSTKDRSVGTGLGLSVTYGIIQEHSGRIEVESEKGKGATFTYHLPRHQGVSVATRIEPPRVTQEEPPQITD